MQLFIYACIDISITVGRLKVCQTGPKWAPASYATDKSSDLRFAICDPDGDATRTIWGVAFWLLTFDLELESTFGCSCQAIILENLLSKALSVGICIDLS